MEKVRWGEGSDRWRFTHWSVFGIELKTGKYVGEGLEGSSF